ncbi:MAG: hypothetical protein ACXABD_20190 [Candidatus Thorarchaeota archaeon]|jgi:hypothetical protein
MRVILKEDVIVKVLRPKSELGIEVGEPPFGSPIDFTRLRYDGEKLVDLYNLDEMYVRMGPSGQWSLHCIEVPGSQLVTMRFWQKKNLIDDSGTYRVRTDEEIEEHQAAKKALTLDNRRLRGQLKDMVKTMTFDKIDTNIDTVFGNLNTAQKNSLKKLYKVTLLLAKQQVRERS